jgi:alanyl-tRNA synthetase
MKSIELRKKFFSFFEKYGHEKVSSSSLIPTEDPTLLFTNAGMNQFKDLLLAKEKRSYNRAVTIQKCVRAGGKHNDLEAVGFTARHLTFFEMMGNFSFGDYFKKEAIRFAWDFLTKEAEFDAQKMFITIHYSDQEARVIWENEIGIPSKKIFELDADNFWQMGDVGPCGPCTEIFVDRGSAAGCGAEDCSPACDCDRFLEVWNVVFMQYNMLADGTKEKLKQTGVDTGMGLERLAMIAQGKDSVFDIDVFQGTKKTIESLTGKSYSNDSTQIRAAFNVLFDHVRSATFLISDGCAPSNEGRGYVLRKIIRRAALFAQKLTEKNIFPDVSRSFIEEMSDIYPDLAKNKDLIASVLTSEIEKFSENLTRGKRILEGYFEQSNLDKKITGEQMFKLYDTYGFPVEIVAVIAQENGFAVDREGFNIYMEKQKQLSGKKMKKTEIDLTIDERIKTEFVGYSLLEKESKIIGIIKNDQMHSQAEQGEDVWLISMETPFFVECGGQIDDLGKIIIHGAEMKLLGLKKINQAILMQVNLKTNVIVNDAILMKVDAQSRLHTMKNHTATHLLQAALQATLGSQVKQAGSVVTPDYLRFDYTYHKPLSLEQIKAIEIMVNEKIWENISLQVQHSTYKEAIARGVIAFFGDKYNHNNVRAVTVPGFSSELCGGTHVQATGEIGAFKIIEETALASGQRRIVALTGIKALENFQDSFNSIKSLSQKLKIKPEEIVFSVEKIDEKLREAEKKIKEMRQKQWEGMIPNWSNSVVKISGVSFLYLELTNYDSDDLRSIVKKLQTIQPGFYFIKNKIESEEGQFLVSIDPVITSMISLEKFKMILQEKCELKGGGNKISLQGGGLLLKVNQEKIKELFLQAMQ